MYGFVCGHMCGGMCGVQVLCPQKDDKLPGDVQVRSKLQSIFLKMPIVSGKTFCLCSGVGHM